MLLEQVFSYNRCFHGSFQFYLHSFFRNNSSWIIIERGCVLQYIMCYSHNYLTAPIVFRESIILSINHIRYLKYFEYRYDFFSLGL